MLRSAGPVRPRLLLGPLALLIGLFVTACVSPRALPATAHQQSAIPATVAVEPTPNRTGCLASAPAPPVDAVQTTVARVVDGDTFELANGIKVRLIGVDTPETVDPRRPVQAYGKEASEYTKALLAGKQVLMQEGQTPRDKYGRTLAWVWVPDGRFVNALLVQEGFAQVYTFADNPDHAALLLSCQREARDGNRGLWAAGESPAPATPVASPPVPKAEPTAASGVVVTKAPGTVRRNATASVTVTAAPGITCGITVSYKSGPSKAEGLGARQTNAQGIAAWSWKVGGNTTPGTWPVVITCGDGSVRTAVTVP